MSMTEKKVDVHEIDRIAKELRLEIWTDCAIKHAKEPYVKVMLMTETLNAGVPYCLMSESVGFQDEATEIFAKNQLLLKLRAIVCPEYSEAQHFRNHYREQAKDLAAQLAKSQESLAYNRGEVNRLNNVIANKDWEIDRLKTHTAEMVGRAIDLSYTEDENGYPSKQQILEALLGEKNAL